MIKTFRPIIPLLLLLLHPSLRPEALAAATIPTQVSEIVRQLHEWRSLTASYVQEAARAANSEAELTELKAKYIEASAVANSLIDQFVLETTAKVPMNPKRYAPHIERAKKATEALVAEAKRLLSEHQPKTRGEPEANASKSLEVARSSVSLAGGLLDIVSKNRRAFLEVSSGQTKEVAKVLATQKWAPLSTVLGQEKRPATQAADTGKK